jgi:pimeloyl-ACP methyl ester carboxylesterase
MRLMASIERDGASLFYQKKGNGDPALVFVHGWTCDHTHFVSQVEHFSAEHQTVVLDLPGHGQSDAVGPFNIEAYSDDVAWLCRALDLDRPVVIGHSMGGMIAVQLGASYPEMVSAVVALDSPFLSPAGLQESVQPLITAMEGPAHYEARKEMAASTIGPFVDPELRDTLIATMCAPERHVAAEAFASVVEWDGAKVLCGLTVPVLAITAGMGGPGGPTDASRLLGECPKLLTGATVGAGHFIQLEVPHQVNAMLERFIELLPGL